jgi:hypothetical protein
MCAERLAVFLLQGSTELWEWDSQLASEAFKLHDRVLRQYMTQVCGGTGSTRHSWGCGTGSTCLLQQLQAMQSKMCMVSRFMQGQLCSQNLKSSAAPCKHTVARNAGQALATAAQ